MQRIARHLPQCLPQQKEPTQLQPLFGRNIAPWLLANLLKPVSRSQQQVWLWRARSQYFFPVVVLPTVLPYSSRASDLLLQTRIGLTANSVLLIYLTLKVSARRTPIPYAFEMPLEK